MKTHFTLRQLALGLCLVGSVVSCQSQKDTFLLSWTQGRAQGIQKVTQFPPSLAFQRLNAHAGLNPAIQSFITEQGYPEYTVEVPSVFHNRIVCYYLKRNVAYLLDTAHRLTLDTRVLGPEPISDKDRKLFDAIKHLEKAAAAYQEES